MFTIHVVKTKIMAYAKISCTSILLLMPEDYNDYIMEFINLPLANV